MSTAEGGCLRRRLPSLARSEAEGLERPLPRAQAPSPQSRVRDCLSLLRTQCVPLCPAEACTSNGTWPSPLLSVTCREGTRSSVLQQAPKGTHSPIALCWPLGGTHWLRGTEAHLSVSSPCDKCQNALFSLVTQIPECSRQQRSKFYCL